MRQIAHAVALVCLGCCFLPASASAQSQITGVVTDSSGGVLPGVTVEAASPALIEKVRSAVTDTEGRYVIVALRPGTYAVTFTLPGFSPLVRDGIALPSDFTATLNAELTVGSLQESVTVSGQGPIVDVQSTQRTTVLERELLDSLPTGRTFLAVGSLVVGIKVSEPNVGGARTAIDQRMSAYGSVPKDTTVDVDGMKANGIDGGGDDQADHNEAMTAEMTVQTGGLSAEVARGGPHMNLIPREGGNTFSGTTYFGYTNGSWQSDNLGDLPSRGLRTPDSVDLLYYANVAVGGPIKRNTLWFFGGYGDNGNNNIVANSFYPDGRPGIYDQRVANKSLRLTWQVTPRNKMTAYGDFARKSLGHELLAGADVATASWARVPRAKYFSSVKWTSTVSNNLLLETGYLQVVNNTDRQYHEGIAKVRDTPEWYTTASRIDLTRGTTTTAPNVPERLTRNKLHRLSSALSYVVGSHTFKSGVQWAFGKFGREHSVNGDLNQRYRDGVPDSVVVFNTPATFENRMAAELGFYVQDSWRLTNRLTVNPGLRFEYLNASIAAAAGPAGRFVPARDFPDVPDLPNWFNMAPRFGVVYDLTGDTKTALKGTVNKYLRSFTVDLANLYDPMNLQSDTRNWSDCDYIVGTSRCSGFALPTNGDDIAQDNEIGPSNNRTFGAAPNRHFDPDSKRPYDLEYTIGVEREIGRGVSASATWFRRDSYNFQQTINRLVDVSDYTPFEVPNPLLNGETLTIYNLNPAKQGLVDLIDTTADRSNARFSFNGFDVSFKARLPQGGSMFGGWSVGKVITVACANLSDPNTFRNCDHSELDIPYRHSLKVAGSYPLPLGLVVSTTVISNPGNVLGPAGARIEPDSSLAVNWAVPANLFPGGRTQAVSVRLDTPGSQYLERLNQVDVNIRRVFRVGRLQFEPGLDVYNLFNSNVVLAQNQNFGSTLGQPERILQGRLVRLTAQMNF